MGRRLNAFLTNKAVWQRQVAIDGYGKTLFETSEIWTRKEEHKKLLVDEKGEQLVSKTRYFCEEAVQVGDLLDGECVREVRAMVNRRGVTVGFEVMA